MRPALGPTRLQLGNDLGIPIAGAWFPYTSRIADELPNLAVAASPRCGALRGIDVNWRDFSRFPGLDSENSPALLPLMTLTGSRVTVTLLVIPPRTSSSLAATLLRQAGQGATSAEINHTSVFRTAGRILRDAARQTRRELGEEPTRPGI